MEYCVYIMTNNRHTVFYTGITNDLMNRAFDHKVKRDRRSFTARYNCTKLAYYEEFSRIELAIKREKQLKRYHRQWKINLINQMNPDWKDLSADWFDGKEFELYKKLDMH